MSVYKVRPPRTAKEFEDMLLAIGSDAKLQASNALQTDASKKQEKKSKKAMSVYNVRPLRTTKEIEDMLWAIGRTSRHSERNTFLFLLGINTGLRVSDLLNLKVQDVQSPSPRIREKKRQKKRTLFLGGIWKEVQAYTAGKPKTDYLFTSQKHDNSPLSPVAVYQMLQKASELLERDDVGTHTMRKTFGYHYYKKTRDIVGLMHIFNHSSEAETKKYIEILDEDLAESLKGFRLG
ncbi:hypothetical protein B4086_5805 [Bacillus cereus]|nr:hypothetical protein B4086_5805 [Bacillus cereus]